MDPAHPSNASLLSNPPLDAHSVLTNMMLVPLPPIQLDSPRGSPTSSAIGMWGPQESPSGPHMKRPVPSPASTAQAPATPKRAYGGERHMAVETEEGWPREMQTGMSPQTPDRG